MNNPIDDSKDVQIMEGEEDWEDDVSVGSDYVV